MRSVAIRKFLALPASAENGFVSQILNIHFVDDLVAIHLDEVVASAARRFDGRRGCQQTLLVEEFTKDWLLLLVDLGGGVGDESEATHGWNEGQPVTRGQLSNARQRGWYGQIGEVAGNRHFHDVR